MNWKAVIATLCIFLHFVSASPVLAEPLKVFVSILPQKFFVEQIGGEHVEVEVLVGPNMSPHSYEPLPRQMAALSRAKLFFGVGVAFEKGFLPKIAAMYPSLRIVNTDAQVKKRNMLEHEEDGHGHHGHDGHFHEKGELDPHIWLDPRLAVQQGEAVLAALREFLPEHQAALEANFAAFKAACEALEAELTALLAPLRGQTMLVFHPAFGYFADRFGLVQRAVEVEGKEPGPRQLAQLIRRCRALGVRVVFVQKQFPVAGAQAVAKAIGGAVVPIDPLAADYFENLRAIGAELSKLGAP